MNSGMVFVLAILSIVMCAHVATTYLKSRKSDGETNDELEQSLAKIEELEERVRVLERIITEHRYDLKKEIDSLR